jgi:hypothetical protein
VLRRALTVRPILEISIDEKLERELDGEAEFVLREAAYGAGAMDVVFVRD